MQPKPKPRKGQTQEENEQEFEDLMELSSYEGTVQLDTNFDTSVTYGPAVDSTTWTTTHGLEPEFIGFEHDNVTVTFRKSEAQHEELRKKYPALEKAYDHYCTLLALAQNGPEDLDN